MIKIYYDEDKDTRLLDVGKSIKKFLDKINYQKMDIYLNEHEGSLWYYVENKGSMMVFFTKIEKSLDDEINHICGDAYGDVGGDYWSVYKIKNNFDDKCGGFGLVFKEFRKPDEVIQ